MRWCEGAMQMKNLDQILLCLCGILTPFKQGNYSLVIADCTAALRIDPDYSKCLLRRAQVHRNINCSRSLLASCGAILHAHMCLQACPGHLQAYETEKKVCEAYDDFERILKLDPSNAYVLLCWLHACCGSAYWNAHPRMRHSDFQAHLSSR